MAKNVLMESFMEYEKGLLNKAFDQAYHWRPGIEETTIEPTEEIDQTTTIKSTQKCFNSHNYHTI